MKPDQEWVHLIAEHHTQYVHGETEQSDVDICDAFNVASVKRGGRAYLCEATAMSMVFDAYMFYTAKSEEFKFIYQDIYCRTLSLHSS